MVALHITELRTQRQVFNCLFERADAAGQAFWLGNAIAATYASDSVWTRDIIRDRAQLQPSLLLWTCRVCEQNFEHHERLIVRAAYWPLETPARLRHVLVIDCGPGAAPPAAVKDRHEAEVARLEALGFYPLTGLAAS
ncbi:hypothetical protein ACH4YO_40685 [Streptomyces noursei]|uniref:hypothetical protein n=1 Tax=Streptomyces noursei TaxID=1971 RepID=UPI0033E87E65